MVENTCKSIIQYQNASDNLIEPFRTERNDKAFAMYEQGKTQYYPNEAPVMYPPGSYSRVWVDHAAAQEFIDWTISTGLTYNINVIYSVIEDFDAIS
jgi:hypothetical protein